MINYILHINGRGGSGKSTLLNALNPRLWLERTSNYTTRQPRYSGELGYHFITEEVFQEKFKQNEIIECYFRKSNNSFYGIPAPTQTGIIQSEIMGLVALRKWCFQNTIPFLSIYLDVDTDTLLMRLQKRSDANEIAEERLAEDEYYELFKEWSDIICDYNDMTVEDGVESVIEMMRDAGLAC